MNAIGILIAAPAPGSSRTTVTLGLMRETSFAVPRMRLDSRRARLLTASVLGEPRTGLMGHAFHVAAVTANAEEPLIAARDASGAVVAERGVRRGSVIGTLLHVIDGAA